MRIFAKYPSLWFQTVILLKENFIVAWNHYKNYSLNQIYENKSGLSLHKNLKSKNQRWHDKFKQT